MPDTKDSRVGIVVGRFQIDKLHDGHMRLLTLTSVTHDRMLVLIGVRPAEASDTNPLNFLDRKVMIQEQFPNAIILPIVDRSNDKVWSRHVDVLINATYGYGVEAVFHVGRDSFEDHYFGQFQIEHHDFGIDEVVARELRIEIRDRTLTTAEGRAGAIKAMMNQSHRTTMMVDMFMVRIGVTLDTYDVLVGKKNGEDLWRLPGGHVDPGESFAHAASREMFEETNLLTSAGQSDWITIGDYEVPDWRVRDTSQIAYKTVLMTAEYFSGIHEGGSDLPTVEWIPITDLMEGRAAAVDGEHRRLITLASQYMEQNPPSFVTLPETEEKNV